MTEQASEERSLASAEALRFNDTNGGARADPVLGPARTITSARVYEVKSAAGREEIRAGKTETSAKHHGAWVEVTVLEIGYAKGEPHAWLDGDEMDPIKSDPIRNWEVTGWLRSFRNDKEISRGGGTRKFLTYEAENDIGHSVGIDGGRFKINWMDK